MMHLARPTWAEVDLGAVAHNLKELRNLLVGTARLMPVVKANAYGHGILEVARTCVEEGAEFLAVALLDEALLLKEAGINRPRILVLGATSEEGAQEAVKQGVRLTCFDRRLAEAVSRVACKLQKPGYIHIKIDTGMGRLGFYPDERALADIEEFLRLPGLEVEGIFTHFAAADAADKSYTEWQLRRFLDFVGELEQKGVKIPLKHAANSAALIDLPSAHLDLVRPGISVYGLWPSDEVANRCLNLIPAMRLLSRIVMLKDLPPGHAVSYGCTYITTRTTKVATVPIGYADGYSRLLSGKVHAVVRGKRVCGIGRICMDQCMFDVSEVEGVREGDEVILFGRPEDGVTADELASLIGTINYEIVCMLGPRIPRIYKRSKL
ncbi:alanine racemase [Syntrophothermus lipocalidus]|uniref:Alanine racemase n=1 Tax=Syntrophothermus lipocalidus (strain DSM 12680 / TGB-C1) TaxID=643648 RepID=D7CPA4_SYNLT|nr:alanine racemase [Syntrophothermus lipocalidus DSM 12680]